MVLCTIMKNNSTPIYRWLSAWFLDVWTVTMVKSDFKLANCVIFPVSRRKYAQLGHAVSAGNLGHSDRPMSHIF